MSNDFHQGVRAALPPCSYAYAHSSILLLCFFSIILFYFRDTITKNLLNLEPQELISVQNIDDVSPFQNKTKMLLSTHVLWRCIIRRVRTLNQNVRLVGSAASGTADIKHQQQQRTYYQTSTWSRNNRIMLQSFEECVFQVHNKKSISSSMDYDNSHNQNQRQQQQHQTQFAAGGDQGAFAESNLLVDDTHNNNNSIDYREHKQQSGGLEYEVSKTINNNIF